MLFVTVLNDLSVIPAGRHRGCRLHGPGRTRGDRYKAKTVIDTVVYRAGDQIGAWVFAPVAALGAGIAGISSVAVVLAAGSTVNAIWLGRKMQRVVRAAERDYAVVATTVDVVLDDPV